VLEALAYLGTQRSFRGAGREVMVRTGCASAFVRAELEHDGHPVLAEAELAAQGRSRVQVNRQRSVGRRELADAVPVTVFSPGDLEVVQGSPVRRRTLLDDALALVDAPAAARADELERILRQRAALLRQAHGRATPEVATSLDVWDERLAVAGEAVVAARRNLLAALEPHVAMAYAALAGDTDGAPVALAYRCSWDGSLADAVAAARSDDLRRAATTVGPHRDDLALGLGGRDARDQASQGEQRSLALALRLAVHALVTDERGAAPILLLDDVFSELDPARCRALVHELPAGQTLISTAAPLPDGIAVAASVDVRTLGDRE
jgi:DNA replication and repair protein RecF